VREPTQVGLINPLIAGIGELAPTKREELARLGFVAGAARGFAGSLGRVLAWGPARYLGRISYGMYVYHNLMPDFVRLCLGALGVPVEALGAAPVLFALATVAVAAAYWWLVEASLNKLKRRYPYFDPPGEVVG
jgi:peptidoglycan/LPS O-acetylase OafA/YrhL